MPARLIVLLLALGAAACSDVPPSDTPPLPSIDEEMARLTAESNALNRAMGLPVPVVDNDPSTPVFPTTGGKAQTGTLDSAAFRAVTSRDFRAERKALQERRIALFKRMRDEAPEDFAKVNAHIMATTGMSFEDAIPELRR